MSSLRIVETLESKLEWKMVCSSTRRSSMRSVKPSQTRPCHRSGGRAGGGRGGARQSRRLCGSGGNRAGTGSPWCR